MLDVADRRSRRGHVIDAIDRSIDLQRLDHVMLDKAVLRVALEMGDVVWFAGGEVVAADVLVPLVKEKMGEVRPEKPGAAGHQNAQKARVNFFFIPLPRQSRNSRPRIAA